MTDPLEGVTWFRQSSVRIRRHGTEVHVDPWGVTEESEADYVLLTHPHYDNFSEEDIALVRGPDTIVLAPATMKKQFADADHYLRPGDMVNLETMDILAVPAHNRERKFHPPEAGWLGYVFTLGDVTYYHTGHTDFLDAMQDLRCDVAFVCCCADYALDPAEAARAGEACGASHLVPIHWGDQVGSRHDAETVARLFSGDVRLLERKDRP